MNKNAKMRVGLALPVALVMASTSWGETKSVKYIDAYGITQEQECTMLTTGGIIASGWYVVEGNVSLSSRIYSSGDLNIILADGAKLSVNLEYSWLQTGQNAIHAGGSLSFYGQENQTGSLDLSITGGYGATGTGRGLSSSDDIVINGGIIHVDASGGTDGICAEKNVVINGGAIWAKGHSSYKGIKAGCSMATSGSITINWADSIYASTFYAHNGSVKLSGCSAFKDESGTSYSGTNPSIDGKKLSQDYLVKICSYTQNNEVVATRSFINGEYKGSSSVNIPTSTEVDAIDFNRNFTVGIPATVVLPFSLPEGTTTNATFYNLESVSPKLTGNNCAWKATMRSIGESALPAANTPYAVILKNGTRLTFDLKGKKAEFSTNEKDTTTVSNGNWHFVGTYSYKAWNSGNDELGLAYGFAGRNEEQIAKGKFGKIALDETDPSKIPYANPLRAYLKKDNANVQLNCPVPNGRPLAQGESAIVSEIPETIDVEFIEDDENGERTTFVGRMNTRTGEFKMERNYDLKGRKLNGAPSARGAYYGKKVIKK